MISVIILGIIQGIAEFLPISSSAHLIIFRGLFGIGNSMSTNVDMTFDIALHFGTLLAIGVYFFKDFLKMITEGVTKGVKTPHGKLFWQLIVATIPAAIVGVLFEDIVENFIRNNYILIGISLIFMGVVLYLADKYFAQKKDIEKISFKDALLIGCAQVFALIPGFSRSGTTISAARMLKMKREDAAKFSFFLSAPVVAGAFVLQMLKKETITTIMANLPTFIVGMASSFIIGLFCIGFLLKYLRKNDFKLFMWYRILLGLAVIILTLIN